MSEFRRYAANAVRKSAASKRAAEKARFALEDAVKAGRLEGMTLRKIAEQLGVTHQWVHQVSMEMGL